MTKMPICLPADGHFLYHGTKGQKGQKGQKRKAPQSN